MRNVTLYSYIEDKGDNNLMYILLVVLCPFSSALFIFICNTCGVDTLSPSSFRFVFRNSYNYHSVL